MTALQMLLALCVGHALCDYPLQGPFLSEAKNPFRPVPGVPWWQAMAAHGAIHGGAVALVTGVWWLGVLEYSAHVIIDFHKCRGDLSYNMDQALHLACKVAWVLIALEVIR